MRRPLTADGASRIGVFGVCPGLHAHIVNSIDEIAVATAEYVARALKLANLWRNEDGEEERSARRSEERTEGTKNIETSKRCRAAPLERGKASERLAQAERRQRGKNQLVCRDSRCDR